MVTDYNPKNSLVCELLAYQQAHGSSCIALAKDPNHAHHIVEQIETFKSLYNPNIKVLYLPDLELLPYDSFSTSDEVRSTRLAALKHILGKPFDVLILTYANMLLKVPPPTYFSGTALNFTVGDEIQLDELIVSLVDAGYKRTEYVYGPGEFTSRGSIIDIYPTGVSLPVRIELFDTTIETIRTFDVDNQLSVESIKQFEVNSSYEFACTDDSIAAFRTKWRTRFSGNPLNSPIYAAISEGKIPQGIEYYLPLFHENLSSIFDYLPNDNTLFLPKNHLDLLITHEKEIQERYEQLNGYAANPLLPPNEVFSLSEELTQRIGEHTSRSYDLNTAHVAHRIIGEAEHELDIVLRDLQSHFGNEWRFIFTTYTIGREEAFKERLSTTLPNIKSIDKITESNLSHESYFIMTSPSDEIISCHDKNLLLIPENTLSKKVITNPGSKASKKRTSKDLQTALFDMSIDDLVTHETYGVGIYKGLQILDLRGHESEFILLEYADGDKIYVPVTSLHLISKYQSATDKEANLTKLGTPTWDKARRKIKQKVYDTAIGLLDIYARRDVSGGYSFPEPDDHYQRFCDDFPFEETDDQVRAITDVLDDMCSEKTMDRLICGDVGFGKTEVALRASFVAVAAKKQVVLLVPTTILALQHFNSFRDRFSKYGVRVELITRSTKKNEAIMADVKSGKVDIVIGTHKLLFQREKFHALGLLIIDEEHRFGVKQKEHFKKLRADVDILTLTATPIPRTLNIAMLGLRDISIIATPPQRRLSTKTFLLHHNNEMVKEAIMREMSRGGQTFYLHNDIESLPRVYKELQQLIPNIRIQIAHGQMKESELELIMRDFFLHQFDLLLCTTIIENGIDIPNANTILINSAHKFGLSQLHQLRGRVGRSEHQAYAYLITPPLDALKKPAQQRLEAIMTIDPLGAGYLLATHDLEIRGAGEILGEDQSGSIDMVGFSTYLSLLEKTIKAIKNNEIESIEDLDENITELDTKIPAFIPENYIPNIHTRLIYYKRVANTSHPEKLKQLQLELIDRFGLLPNEVKSLFELTEYKIRAQALHIRRIELRSKSIKVTYKEKADLNIETIIDICHKKPGQYKLINENTLKRMRKDENQSENLNWLSTTLDEIASFSN